MGIPERTDAMPEAWYARVQFDELLDPSIEDLVANVDAMGVPDGTYTGTLANTQPVTLQCASSMGAGAMVDVPYDGYYSPSGNSISYPLGPSLVIIPADPTVVATASECTVTLKANIKDKDGNQVPADQRGPYKFRTGAITVVAIDPTTDDSKQDPIAAGVDITFNTTVDPASLTPGDPGPPVVPATFAFAPMVDNPYAGGETPEEYFFGADFPVSGGPYTFTFVAGSKLLDVCGKATTLGAPSVDDLTQTTLTTNALKLTGITGATEPGAMINIAFNQYMDVSTLLPAEFSISPAVTCQDCVNAPGVDVEYSPSGNILIHGNFQLGTAYTFTLNAGATIDDCPGFEPTCVKSTTYTAAAAQPVMFTTAPSILLKTISLKDNATESAAASAAGITLTFNQEMDPTTFVQGTDYTLSPNVALAPGPGSSYEKISLVPAAPLPPGSYTFTLLKSGSVSDLVTPTANTFSPSADQVIHFTVTPNPTAMPHKCL